MSYPFLIHFTRGEPLKYLGHLDMLRLWERAFRRSGLPVAYSQGFNPHLKLSLAAPLSVGMTSVAEYLDIELEKVMKPLDLIQSLKSTLPEGIEILESRLSPYKSSLAALVALIEYKLWVVPESSDVLSKLEDFKNSVNWPYIKNTKSGEKEIDLKEFVRQLEVIEQKNGQVCLKIQIKTGPLGSVKAEEIMQALKISSKLLSIQRMQIFFRSADGQYFLP